MTIDPALLAAVIAAPDDDLIRLQVADWCEEHGQPARAEFVRVQVELAAKPWNVLRNPLNREYAALRRRERKLLLESPGQHRLSECPKGFGPCTGYTERPDGLQFAWLALNGPGEPVWFQFRRGFVSQVTCTWADWTAHAAAILAACPIRRVNRPKTCERCRGFGSEPLYDDVEISCPACRGTGKVEDWRGEGVVWLTDEPMPTENNFRPGRWAWIHESVPWERPDGPHLTALPAAVFDNLVGGPGSVPLCKWYDSPGAAVEDFRAAREKTWPGVRFEPTYRSVVPADMNEGDPGPVQITIAPVVPYAPFYPPVLRAETDP